jgi:drug/metabolite transporter (DMT)-like permease
LHVCLPLTAVAFVQMLKAFTPVSTMLSSFMFGLEKPSAKLIAAVGCISLGVVVSSFGEVNFSTFGVLAMLTSIAAEGVRTCLMQHMLSSKQFHPLEAWMYLGPACIIWLLLLIGLVEGQAIREQQALSIVAAHKWYFAFAALAGFAVNALAMMVIKLASALTLKVLGVCKDVGLVTFGVLLLGENVAVLQVGGYGIALSGFAAYNYIKAFTPAPALDLPKVGKGSKGLSRQDSIVYLSSSNGSSDGSSNIKKKKGLSTVSSRSSTVSHLAHQQEQQYNIAACHSIADAAHPLLAPTVPHMLCVKSH